MIKYAKNEEVVKKYELSSETSVIVTTKRLINASNKQNSWEIKECSLDMIAGLDYGKSFTLISSRLKVLGFILMAAGAISAIAFAYFNQLILAAAVSVPLLILGIIFIFGKKKQHILYMNIYFKHAVSNAGTTYKFLAISEKSSPANMSEMLDAISSVIIEAKELNTIKDTPISNPNTIQTNLQKEPVITKPAPAPVVVAPQTAQPAPVSEEEDWDDESPLY